VHGLVSRRINAERIVLLGWSRAILLQVAHPLIAAGVAEHSGFRGGRFAAAARLHHTVRAMLALAFGDHQAQTAALEGIRAIHRRVHGRLAVATGDLPAGTPYSAEDPDLLLWVHATLLDSVLTIYEDIVAPLTERDRDAYCAEAAQVAIDLGARDADVPRTHRALTAYLARMLGSRRIAVGDQARAVAAGVLAPPFAWLFAPVAWTNTLVTVGLLPDRIRREYGFVWSARRERALAIVMGVLRACRKITPPVLAQWREARRPDRTPLPSAPPPPSRGSYPAR
jgi:uncharacterized protein (DUF2236 family)